MAEIWSPDKVSSGDMGACNVCNPSGKNSERWSTNKLKDITFNTDEKDPNSRVCTFASTYGNCEFRMKDLNALQVDMQSSGCDNIWVAPLWISPPPGHWNPPQHATGEIDLFERGCIPGPNPPGYILSYGEGPPYIYPSAWGETDAGKPSNFRAFMKFDQAKDEITTYTCPIADDPSKWPIKIGPEAAGCTKTSVHNGYFSDSAKQTAGQTEWMHFVSDVWNKCDALPCGGDRRTPQTKFYPDSQCSFSVSNIQMGFKPESIHGGPFKDILTDPNKQVCLKLVHPNN